MGPIKVRPIYEALKPKTKIQCLPGPEIIGGEDRDKEGRKGESLSLVESLKIGKAEAVQCVHGSASGEARSSTKAEGTEINCDNHRCSNEGSLSSRDRGPQTSCINQCCEEGGGDNVGVEISFDSSGEEGEVKVGIPHMLGSEKSAHLFFADTRYCCDDRLLVGAESM
ncbi:hypothetical protein VNO80_10439 [Phaseolus coccineus]|uniref:Uncharacterized protein n=1 Tax=Phaseolus coccineus TaxID=3886 RepID=A0AAN9N851_PHACN